MPKLPKKVSTSKSLQPPLHISEKCLCIYMHTVCVLCYAAVSNKSDHWSKELKAKEEMKTNRLQHCKITAKNAACHTHIKHNARYHDKVFNS